MKKEILFQLDIAWQLFEYHCHNLSEEEAMWCKTNQGLQIRKVNGVCYFQERNLLIDNEVQRILQASMDKGEIAKMNVKDTSYLLQASVLGVVMLWLHKQDQSLKKLTELCIDQIIGINHGEEGEKEDAR